MEAKKQEFLQLIDRAIALSEKMQGTTSNSTEKLNTLVSELQRIKANVMSDRLQPSEGTLTLGLARAVADWVEPLNSPLLDAVGAIELYYQQQF
ncbi:hypothetical protein IQ264_13510 [Phormidium sp. LEGE 05292]|uniref:hypothetical protein n=1 Tax=[Phormidium] sp. LEGE 05292 TaxID=767427 RepID=UPI00187F19A1|nr:hypothetical protein [Phormidium sp. LEGE 05292]MBE9226440.1 hypothetical protein [Phormidium sp. LEGE 05292]